MSILNLLLLNTENDPNENNSLNKKSNEDLLQEMKKQNKILNSLIETFSIDRKSTRGLEQIKQFKNNTTKSIVKTSNFISSTIGIIFKIVIVGSLLYFFADLFSTLFNLINGYSPADIFDSSETYIILGIIFTSIFVMGIIGIWRYGGNYTSNKIYVYVFWITFTILLIYLVKIFLFSGTYENDENKQFIVDETKSGFSNFIQEITCAFNIECQLNKVKDQNTEITKRAEYTLKFNKPLSAINYALSDLNNPIRLNYNLVSEEGLTIIKHECYYNRVREENKISEKMINKEENTFGNEATLDGMECINLNNIKLENNNEQEVTIISVLTMSLDTTFRADIPAIDYEKYLTSNGYDTKYSFIYLKNELDKFTENDKKFVSSNDALKITNVNFKLNLPLLLGDGDDRDISFLLRIQKNDNNNFGNLISGQINDIKIPYTLKFLEEPRQNETIEFDNEIYEKNIRIQEVDSAVIPDIKIVQDLTIETTSIFEKKSSFQIKIKLTDEEIEAIKNKENSANTNSNSETSQNNENTQTGNNSSINQSENNQNSTSLYDESKPHGSCVEGTSEDTCLRWNTEDGSEPATN